MRDMVKLFNTERKNLINESKAHLSIIKSIEDQDDPVKADKKLYNTIRHKLIKIERKYNNKLNKILDLIKEHKLKLF